MVSLAWSQAISRRAFSIASISKSRDATWSSWSVSWASELCIRGFTTNNERADEGANSRSLQGLFAALHSDNMSSAWSTERARAAGLREARRRLPAMTARRTLSRGRHEPDSGWLNKALRRNPGARSPSVLSLERIQPRHQMICRLPPEHDCGFVYVDQRCPIISKGKLAAVSNLVSASEEIVYSLI